MVTIVISAMPHDFIFDLGYTIAVIRTRRKKHYVRSSEAKLLKDVSRSLTCNSRVKSSHAIVTFVIITFLISVFPECVNSRLNKNDNRREYKYVCMTTNQPNTKPNPNPDANPNPTTE